MLTVYLLRHGETRWNADGNRYCGATDIGLTDKGVQQAHQAANVLKFISFDAVYSSPLQRATRTAQIASGKLNEEVIKDHRLIEANFGDWEGKTKEEFIAENAGLWEAWCLAPDHTRAGGNGETAMEVVDRVDDFFQEIAKKHPSGTILVFAHNAVNRFYMAWKLGMPLKNYRKLVQENSSITLFSLDEMGEFSLLKLNSR
ncbi:histidine phosphatase family protein [Spirosoma endbachense]|uniref:Histidine phosphatase family protein n=1 Tax=Spirosoma endbachense TaxID=2666025 RepID=A0A6P1VXC7_9BACT|nr:histidine phosphatase family protein [Spirosoma endbachense]QHV97841.1 histidine phosphatase family protein [Spirosoma endbachense]